MGEGWEEKEACQTKEKLLQSAVFKKLPNIELFSVSRTHGLSHPMLRKGKREVDEKYGYMNVFM